MSGEIKFRAWNEEELRIVDWNDCFFYDTSEVTNYSGDFNYIEMSLMQYVGLKDKNNQEIYESDIVKFKDFIFTINKECSSFNLVRISFDTDMYELFTNCWNDDVYPLIQLYWEEDCEEHILDCLEVIGNIYENDELLKGGL